MDTIQISSDVFAAMCVALTIVTSVCGFQFMDLRRERMRRSSTEAAYASVNGTLSEIKSEEKYISKRIKTKRNSTRCRGKLLAHPLFG